MDIHAPGSPLERLAAILKHRAAYFVAVGLMVAVVLVSISLPLFSPLRDTLAIVALLVLPAWLLVRFLVEFTLYLREVRRRGGFWEGVRSDAVKAAARVRDVVGEAASSLGALAIGLGVLVAIVAVIAIVIGLGIWGLSALTATGVIIILLVLILISL